MRTLKSLLGICEHEWKIINQVRVNNDNGEKIGNKYHLQCSKCGDIKIRETVT